MWKFPHPSVFIQKLTCTLHIIRLHNNGDFIEIQFLLKCFVHMQIVCQDKTLLKVGGRPLYNKLWNLHTSLPLVVRKLIYYIPWLCLVFQMEDCQVVLPRMACSCSKCIFSAADRQVEPLETQRMRFFHKVTNYRYPIKCKGLNI